MKKVLLMAICLLTIAGCSTNPQADKNDEALDILINASEKMLMNDAEGYVRQLGEIWDRSIDVAIANSNDSELKSVDVVEFQNTDGENYIVRAYEKFPDKEVTFERYSVNFIEETVSVINSDIHDYTYTFDEIEE